MKSEVCEFCWLHVPYRLVRGALLKNPAGLIGPAAEDAVHHSTEHLTTLGVDIAGIQLERRVRLSLGTVVDIKDPIPILRLPMRWHAEARPDLYPIMAGMFEAYPISGDRTQLSIQGSYQPPFGWLGEAIDALALHTVAAATVARFLEEIAAAIAAALASPPDDQA